MGTWCLHFSSYWQLVPSLIFYPLLPYLHCTTPPLPPTVMDKAIDLHCKCGHFCILVIGRANAGKTMLLKKVCNSVEDPEIFDPSGKKVMGTHCIWMRQVNHLIPTRLIAAWSHCSPGVIGGINNNPTQLRSHLLFRSMDYMILITSSYLKAIPNLFSTILLDLNLALWVKLRQWTLSSQNEPKAWTCLPNYMQYGMALTKWFYCRLRDLTLGIVSLWTPTSLY